MEGEEHFGSNHLFVLMPGMSPSWLLQAVGSDTQQVLLHAD